MSCTCGKELEEIKRVDDGKERYIQYETHCNRTILTGIEDKPLIIYYEGIPEETYLKYTTTFPLSSSKE